MINSYHPIRQIYKTLCTTYGDTNTHVKVIKITVQLKTMMIFLCCLPNAIASVIRSNAVPQSEK